MLGRAEQTVVNISKVKSFNNFCMFFNLKLFFYLKCRISVLIFCQPTHLC